ncbi:uncharacterized protein IL334_007796 [Kwoniella shivajii]|uniref:Pre-rRNA-processing protein RIX1 n=1 Tax=Kwoniella shivajii TaxID=564305 RepID=A0ABZ1DDK5_9TREE|nr:hypothetical protein IL334_007796 [Kwoniella shivajii]
MPAYTSASGLIKHLRAPNDPPQPDLPSKIDIALAAWNDFSFHVPRKADVLRDWVLESWTRNHKGSPAQAPLQIISSLFKSLGNADEALLAISCQTITLLFPSQQLIHKTEAYAEVWIAQIVAVALPAHCKAYRTHCTLQNRLTQTTSALLFTPTTLSDPLQPILSQPINHYLPFALPALFHSLISIYHTHRYSIFTQASSSKLPHDVFVASKERDAVRNALTQFLAYLETFPPSLELHTARSSLWQSIESWGGYVEREITWGQLLRAEAHRSEQALSSNDPAVIGVILFTLAVLERLDHDQAQLGPNIVRWCLAVSVTIAIPADDQCPATHRDVAGSVLSSLLRFFQLTHSLPAFFRLIVSSLNGLFTADLPDDIVSSLYTLITEGPLVGKHLRQDMIYTLRSVGNARGTTNEIVTLLVLHLEQSRSTASAAMIGVTSRLICYCLQAKSATDAISDLVSLLSTWSPTANPVIEAGRLRIARNVERFLHSSCTPYPNLPIHSLPELCLETLRFIFHRGALEALPIDTIDAVLIHLSNPSSEQWQVVIDQGIVLLE